MKAKILLLEDDPGINRLLTLQLQSEGYEVVQAFDGEQAIQYFNTSFHLAILDIMVPKINGFAVLEHIRKDSLIPVLFLTARNEDIDKMQALGMGADDYITKPFSLTEIVYRCKAHLRRAFEYTQVRNQTILTHHDLVLNKDTFEVSLNGAPLQLNVKEFELLTFFMTHVSQVFTKQQLYEQVWQADFFGDDNTVMVHISRLREKLNDNPKRPTYIKTIKGLGYRMEK
ncbi:response regulator transcription factor [Gottschalkiaceae bacterium SANA]|nr:response regulator transcription factor [Gottschalkiaceae bacterium SANA]